MLVIKANCDVIQDLITLYVDELTSESSKGLVEEHIKECHQCKMFLESIKEEENIDLIDECELNSRAEIDLVMKIKESLIKSKVLFVIIGAILGIIFSAGENMINGFIVIPLVGALIYIVTRKIWVAPTLIFIFKLIEFSIYYFMEGYGGLITYLTGCVPMALIYVIFTSIGVLIGWLIKEIFLTR